MLRPLVGSRSPLLSLAFLLLAACAGGSGNRSTAVVPSLPVEIDRSLQTEDKSFSQDALLQETRAELGDKAAEFDESVAKVYDELGPPTGYILGGESGLAVVLGLRYGSGILHRKGEEEDRVYWTSPSMGPDVGVHASTVLLLIYNAHEKDDLFGRYAQYEAHGYYGVGGSIAYHRRKDVVIVPIRAGIGIRFGANFGHFKLTDGFSLFPF